jgi:hypothetical protein
MKYDLIPTELHSLSKLPAAHRFRAHGERSAIKSRCSISKCLNGPLYSLYSESMARLQQSGGSRNH